MTHNLAASRQSPVFLRFALGLVYFHFGALKLFPDLSPAEMLASQTVMSVSLHWMDAGTALRTLAFMECGIGLCLMLNILPRLTFLLFSAHMIGTFMPLFVLPEFTFQIAPFAPNLEGQYIFKNIVFVAAGWTVLMPHAFSGRLFRRTADRANSSIPSSEPLTHDKVSATTP